MPTLKEFVDQIVEDGVLTSDEHEQFIELVTKDGKIDDDERAEISRLFKMIQEGKLKVIDEERERYQKMRTDDLMKNLSRRPLGTTTENEE